MKENKYLRRQLGLRTIVFPERVVPNIFEHVLREAYKSTLSKRVTKVRFDFGLVKWCEIFELSLIALWILELLQAEKNVIFVLPTDKQVYQFLVTYRFDAFLIDHNIETEREFEYKSAAGPTDLIRAPFFPLTFLNQTRFRKLLEDLNYGNRLEVVLADISNAEIVKSGAIRDIVLKELLDNAILHGDVRFAYLIMTKLGSSSPQTAPEWTRHVLENVSELERPFFERLHGQPFINLVIGDKGAGIKETLKDAYAGDPIVRRGHAEPTDNQIIEYSFLYHSTRRSLEERIGAIKDVISAEARNYPPATGLHRLKEIVRDFRGFLYVRTGGSILSYDFYNNPMLTRPDATLLSGKKKSVDFGGTQYKLYFPITLPAKHFGPPKRLIDVQYLRAIEYAYVSVRRYVANNAPCPPEEEAHQLHSIFSEIDRAAFQHRDEFLSIVLDFEGVVGLSAKALHYLLFESMQRQSPTLSIIPVNLRDESRQWQTVFDQIHVGHLRRVLLAFSPNFGYQFFGATSEQDRLLHELMDSESPQTEEMRILAENNSHIFSLDHDRDRYQSDHSRIRIIEIASEAVKNELAQVLVSPASGIFHEEAKVLLPSNKYCSGFFEIYKLLTNRHWKALLSAWYRYWLLRTTPDYVISISRHMGELTEDAISNLRSGVHKQIQHIKLRTPLSQFDLVRLLLKLERGKKGILLTEVIGSGDTLSSILTNVQHTNVLKILPVIDASQASENQFEFKGRSYEIETVLKRSFTYHPDLPQGWSYSDIQQVDPDKHLLTSPAASPEGPLWKKIKVRKTRSAAGKQVELHYNEFLDDYVVPTNSFLEGHFTNEGNHILYLFNVPALVAYFSEEMATVITENIKRHLSIIKPSRLITHVLYYCKARARYRISCLRQLVERLLRLVETRILEGFLKA